MELWGNYIAYQLFYHEFIWACLVFWYSVILYSNYSFFKQCPLLLKQHNALERPTSRELAQDNFNNNSGRSKIFVDLFSYLVVRRLFLPLDPPRSITPLSPVWDLTKCLQDAEKKFEKSSRETYCWFSLGNTFVLVFSWMSSQYFKKKRKRRINWCGSPLKQRTVRIS